MSLNRLRDGHGRNRQCRLSGSVRSRDAWHAGSSDRWQGDVFDARASRSRPGNGNRGSRHLGRLRRSKRRLKRRRACRRDGRDRFVNEVRATLNGLGVRKVNRYFGRVPLFPPQDDIRQWQVDSDANVRRGGLKNCLMRVVGLSRPRNDSEVPLRFLIVPGGAPSWLVVAMDLCSRAFHHVRQRSRGVEHGHKIINFHRCSGRGSQARSSGKCLRQVEQ